MIFLKTAALLVSMFGLVWGAARRFRTTFNTAIPAVMISIGAVMTFAGILNVMYFTALIIMAAGLCLAAFFGYSAFKSRLPAFDRSVLPGLVFLAAGAAFAAWYHSGCRFTFYDDFSHWGLVSRTILENHRLPNFLDTVIQFQSYPTGSACFLYYFCFFSGSSEGVMMFWQTVFGLACMLPLFDLVRRHNWLGYCAITVWAVYSVIYSMPFLRNLHVDKLLSYIFIAGLGILLSKRNDPESALILAIPAMIMLVLTKTSGIFFGILLCALSLLILRGSGRRFLIRAAAAGLAANAGSFILWRQHTFLVFRNPSSSKHSISMDKYSSILHSRTEEQTADIIRLWLDKTFLSSQLYIILALLGIFILLSLLMRSRKNTAAGLWVLGGNIAVYTAYSLGVLAMYLFSMPVGEAVTLAGFDRYMMSIFIVNACSALIYLLYILGEYDPGIELGTAVRSGAAKSDHRVWQLAGVYAAVVCTAITAMSLAGGFRLSSYERPAPNANRIRAEELWERGNIENGSSYLLVTGNSYFNYVMRYTYPKASITYMPAADGSSFSELEKYSEVYVIQPTEEQQAVMAQIVSSSDAAGVPVYIAD